MFGCLGNEVRKSVTAIVFRRQLIFKCICHPALRMILDKTHWFKKKTLSAEHNNESIDELTSVATSDAFRFTDSGLKYLRETAESLLSPIASSHEMG